jgi:hypothetical protein
LLFQTGINNTGEKLLWLLQSLFFLQNCEPTPLPMVSLELLWKDESIDTSPTLIRDPGENFSPVSTTPAINVSSVSTSPAITEKPWQGLIAGVVLDTCEKFMAAVVDTGEQLIA